MYSHGDPDGQTLDREWGHQANKLHKITLRLFETQKSIHIESYETISVFFFLPLDKQYHTT